MIPVIYLMYLRFLRLRLWVPGLIVPLVLFALAVYGGDSRRLLAAKVLIDVLVYLLPALGILTVLTAVRRSHWSMILTRPVGFPRLLVGIWLGCTLPYLACHMVLLLAAVGVLAFVDGMDAVEYNLDIRFWRGTPTERLAGPGLTGVERLRWLEMDAPWTFEFRGVDEGRDEDGPLEARIITSVGRTSLDESNGEARPELYRSRSVRGTLHFQDVRGAARCAPVSLELLNERKVLFSIPREAVLDDGRLLVVVARETRPAGAREGEGHEHAAGAESSQARGEYVFWFDDVLSRDFTPGSDGAYRVTLGERLLPSSGVLLVKTRRSFSGSVFRLGLLAAGLLPLVTAMATAAATVFGSAVAFAFNLTLFVCGVTMGFLREVVDSLSVQSARVILGDPARHHAPHDPGWFESGLQRFLEFWIAVLPDFRPFHGGDCLLEAEVVRWSIVWEVHVVSACYVGCFLLAAFLLLLRWELGR